MRSRDLAIVLGVLLLAGFAAADALRGDRDRAPPPEAAGETTSATDAEREERGTPSAPFAPVRAPGSLLFTDAEAGCRVREIRVRSGSELPLPPLRGNCDLWVPRVGARIAYGLGAAQGDSIPFRFFDLGHPNRNLGGSHAWFGFLVFSLDGQRAAWCSDSGTGFDLEFNGDLRRFPECANAYTEDGELAFARGRRLVADGQTLLRAPGPITFVSIVEGSIAVVVNGERVVVHHDGAVTLDVALPRRLHGRVPVFSPDHCAALFRPPGRADAAVELFPFDCFRGRARDFFGRTAAWSPDGRWIAVAEQATVAFHRVVGRPAVVRWRATAGDLGWRA